MTQVQSKETLILSQWSDRPFGNDSLDNDCWCRERWISVSSFSANQALPLIAN
jgi:hypothetical protein